MSTFDSTKRLLPDIPADIVKGKIQLPDFQRGWVWDDDHLCSLLVSVARSFPVGAVMLLDMVGEVRSQLRSVDGWRWRVLDLGVLLKEVSGNGFYRLFWIGALHRSCERSDCFRPRAVTHEWPV